MSPLVIAILFVSSWALCSGALFYPLVRTFNIRKEDADHIDGAHGYVVLLCALAPLGLAIVICGIGVFIGKKIAGEK